MCVQYENNPGNAFRDIVWNLNYHLPSITVKNDLKIEGKQLGQRSQPPKGPFTPPKRCVCAT